MIETPYVLVWIIASALALFVTLVTGGQALRDWLFLRRRGITNAQSVVSRNGFIKEILRLCSLAGLLVIGVRAWWRGSSLDASTAALVLLVIAPQVVIALDEYWVRVRVRRWARRQRREEE